MTIAFDFHGRKVLVTGGSKGIGRAIADSFIKAGASVAICARGQEELGEFRKTFPGNQSFTIQADAANEADVKRVVADVAKQFGGLDILVNNVGGAIQFGNLWTTSTKNWIDAFELNVLSMVNFCKEAVPLLRASSFPRIINISSLSGVEPGFFNPHYTSTKAATINFSKYLANSLASENILVNCICPGSVETDSWERSLNQIAFERNSPKEEIRSELALQEKLKIPLKRMGKGEDISPLVLFLASELSVWTTGSCFHINGGKMRGMS